MKFRVSIKYATSFCYARSVVLNSVVFVSLNLCNIVFEVIIAVFMSLDNYSRNILNGLRSITKDASHFAWVTVMSLVF